MIDSLPNRLFPLKVFYELPCFRNELIDTLSGTKHRQFRQFGTEILGAANLSADTEILTLISEMLGKVGVPLEYIVVRISDVRLFNRLVHQCNISHEDSISLKEAMDTIAECRAGKGVERRNLQEQQFWQTLAPYNLSISMIECWKAILNHESGQIDRHIRTVFSGEFTNVLNDLSLMAEELKKFGMNTRIDLCVVRSHEYYTGLSFELDVVTKNERFVEIAGGGRYDKLVGNFVTITNRQSIPSTGFAFGVERVMSMLESIGGFSASRSVDSVVAFEESSADTLIMATKNLNPVASYLKALSAIRVPEFTGQRLDIYVGDDRTYSTVDRYMQERGIGVKREI